MAKLFFSRDISWLGFNQRVLQEAEYQKNNLANRIRFLGIFAHHLDEFLKTRVAKLKNFDSNSVESSHQKELSKIRKIIEKDTEKVEKIWNDIREKLGEENIFIRNNKNIGLAERDYIISHFEAVTENINPIFLDECKDVLTLKDNILYLGICFEKKFLKKYAVLEVPLLGGSRFIKIPSTDSQVVVFSEEIIRLLLPRIFPNVDNIESFAFKITKKHKPHKPSKLPYLISFDKNMPDDLLNFISQKAGVSERDIFFPSLDFQNMKDLEELSKLLYSRQKIESLPPLKSEKNICSFLEKKDILLVTPYESFSPVLRLLEEASADPDVTSIKMSIYRLAPDSKIMKSLIKAVENGKKVSCIIELNAKGDELNNLNWAEKLKSAGVKVLANRFHKKIHAKFCVIKGKKKRFAIVSTGNFNEETAKTYSDMTLMTADERVFSGLNLLFKNLKTAEKKNNTVEHNISSEHIMVSPTDMREQIISKIDTEIHEALAGKKAHIILKANAVSDKKIIKKLYEAAAAGVKIEMIVRGIYCIINQENFKHKIQAISIIDEYLEHSRVMYFYNTGEEDIYISSADWLKKNMELRVEIAVKITAPYLKNKIKKLLNIYLKDNVKARILEPPFRNYFVQNNEPPVRSQREIFRYLKTQKI